MHTYEIHKIELLLIYKKNSKYQLDFFTKPMSSETRNSHLLQYLQEHREIEQLSPYNDSLSQ